MALGVLNNISAIYAQNNLANTQASLSKTLQQLSSGSRINSGADDAAGLSLANGLQASSTALSQSAKNASEGVDFLQVADGALSQVTSLLNRGITLATEASNGTLNSSQMNAADSEYQKILTEINTINNNTEYNGLNVFKTGSNTSPINIFTSDGSKATSYNNAATDLVGTDAITLGIGNAVKVTGTVVASTDPTAAVTVNAKDSASANHNMTITLTHTTDANTFTYAVTATDSTDAAIKSGGTGAITFDASTGTVKSVTGDPVTVGHGTAATSTFSNFSFSLDFSSMKLGAAAVGLGAADSTSSLTSAAAAQNALTAINSAISLVAGSRGTVGANINTLSAVGNVMTMQSTNTLAGENDVTATDYGQATSDMSKYQILSQTGIAALSQANQSQQLITKLLQ